MVPVVFNNTEKQRNWWEATEGVPHCPTVPYHQVETMGYRASEGSLRLLGFMIQPHTARDGKGFMGRFSVFPIK